MREAAKRDPWPLGYEAIKDEEPKEPFTTAGASWWALRPRKPVLQAPHDFTRILVVEPNAYHRRVLRVLLASPHVSLIEVETGTAAIDLLGIKSFDLVILHIDADLQAIGTVKWIRRNPTPWSDIPILGLIEEAALGSVSTGRMIADGLTDWTIKPIRRNELSDKLFALMPGLIEPKRPEAPMHE